MSGFIRCVAAIVLLVSAAVAEEVEIRKDVPFLPADRAEKLDAYLPPESFPRPVPAVVFIHGGGWEKGDKAANREQNVGKNLAAQGFAVFSINYLLNRRDENGKLIVAWPTNLHDCKSAVRFIRAESKTFGIDPERVAVIGGSAGGHLALLVGTTAEVAELNQGGVHTDQSNAVSCIVDFYGVVDVRTNRSDRFAGATEEETRKNAELASPVTHLGPKTPPILVVHGTADKTVSIEESRELVKLLVEKKIPHEYVEVPEGPHSFDLQPKQMDLRPVVIKFLREHLAVK